MDGTNRNGIGVPPITFTVLGVIDPCRHQRFESCDVFLVPGQAKGPGEIDGVVEVMKMIGPEPIDVPSFPINRAQIFAMVKEVEITGDHLIGAPHTLAGWVNSKLDGGLA